MVLLVTSGVVGAWLLYQQRITAQARQVQTDREVSRIRERARVWLEEGWQAADLEKMKAAEAEGLRANDVAHSGGANSAERQEIDLKPDFGLTHLNLGLALMRQSQFHEAAASLNKAADLLAAQDPRREQARRLQEQAQRYPILAPRLPAILQGMEKPANAAEQIDLARLCLYKTNQVAAAGFFRDAFAADPRLAEDKATDARYNAACAAVLAGCGQGKDRGQSGR